MCLPIVKNQAKDLSDIWLLAWYFLGLKLHLFFNQSIYNSSDMWTQRHVGPLMSNSTYIKNNNTYALIYHSFFIYLFFVFTVFSSTCFFYHYYYCYYYYYFLWYFSWYFACIPLQPHSFLI